MKQFISILTAALSLTMSAHANLGDSRDDARHRYGKPVGSNDKGALIYQKNGWEINQVYNSKGWCFFVSYKKLDGTQITTEECTAIDRANGVQANKWAYQQFPDTETETKQTSYFDPISGFQLFSEWMKQDGRWLACRMWVNNNLRPAEDNSNQQTENNGAETVPL